MTQGDTELSLPNEGAPGIPTVQITFDSSESAELADRLRRELNDPDLRLMTIGDGSWMLVWSMALSAKDTLAWSCGYAVRVPWRAPGNWYLLTPLVWTSESLEATIASIRVQLDRGLSLHNVLTQMRGYEQWLDPGIGFYWWAQIDDGVIAYDSPGCTIGDLEVLLELNDLTPQARAAGIRLWAGGWSGTPAELGEAAKTITGEVA